MIPNKVKKSNQGVVGLDLKTQTTHWGIQDLTPLHMMHLLCTDSL